MNALEKEIAALVRTDQLFDKGDRVVIGVSGGSDSMALLHVLAALRPVFDLHLHAVYVDHGLRPDETGQEAELVQAQALLLRVEYLREIVDVPAYVRQRGLSVEEAARQLRYAIFEKTAQKVGAGRIAVAHTGDDQAEEVLLRLVRGTGRKGLAGMDLIREGMVVRPFLNVTKTRLLQYLEERHIPFCEDSSNRDRRFLRNRIRLDLIPYLQQYFNPAIGRTLRSTALILRDEESYLEDVSADAFVSLAEIAGTPGKPDCQISFVTERLTEVPRAIQRRLMEKALWLMGCRPGSRIIDRILAIMGTLAVVHLRQGLRICSRAGRLNFSYPQGRVALRGNLLHPGGSSFSVSIDGPGTYPLPGTGQTLLVELLAEPPAGWREEVYPDFFVEYLDAGYLNFPLLVRSPRSGDRFRPLGGPGSKKVGDWLTDRKVPPEERWRVPVLVADDIVVALLGHRIGHQFRITGTTKNVLRLTLVAG